MHRFDRRFLLKVSLASLIGASLAHAQQDLRGALRRGGQVIYFRHGATTRSGVDRIEWPRARQRLLSDLGIRQSEQIGAAFRSEGFPVGDVLASPFARCRDMAEIAFGRVEERMELMGLLSDDDGRAARVAYLRERMTTPPAIGTNRIIVSHRSNIAQVAGASLEEGEAVITRPNGTDFETLAQWMPADWTGA
ncbi:MAG: histidine phosphatase family protein [Pseudomonadota bacterium]